MVFLMVAWPSISEITSSDGNRVFSVYSSLELISQTLVIDPPLPLGFGKLLVVEVVQGHDYRLDDIDRLLNR